MKIELQDFSDMKENVVPEFFSGEKGMADLEAVEIIEGMSEASNDRMVDAYAHLIKSGMVWQLQGSYGRSAQTLIDIGWVSEDGEVLSYGD